jgi:hypothetical protein
MYVDAHGRCFGIAAHSRNNVENIVTHVNMHDNFSLML